MAIALLISLSLGVAYLNYAIEKLIKANKNLNNKLNHLENNFMCNLEEVNCSVESLQMQELNSRDMILEELEQ